MNRKGAASYHFFRTSAGGSIAADTFELVRGRNLTASYPATSAGTRPKSASNGPSLINQNFQLPAILPGPGSKQVIGLRLGG